ncbi:MAG: hypothetical protein NUV50_11855 [Rhodospirillales bacterium]|nr:hypothetical protein [Rhodospirillales bacterium]
MSVETKTPSFGRKGVSDHAKSWAEFLLSGKPLARAPQKDRTPKLKARPKAKFGRKQDSDRAAFCRDEENYRWGQNFSVLNFLRWKFWAIMLAAVMLGI